MYFELGDSVVVVDIDTDMMKRMYKDSRYNLIVEVYVVCGEDMLSGAISRNRIRNGTPWKLFVIENVGVACQYRGTFSLFKTYDKLGVIDLIQLDIKGRSEVEVEKIIREGEFLYLVVKYAYSLVGDRRVAVYRIDLETNGVEAYSDEGDVINVGNGKISREEFLDICNRESNVRMLDFQKELKEINYIS
jgi:hypothetical protein